MQPGQQPQVYVINQNAKRERGDVARINNIRASKTVADIIRTTLGPRSMLKMILDPMGGIVMTNDGNAILREIDVSHPAAKSMIELARSTDEQVGDGTTSVIILAGETIALAEPLLQRGLHPIVITQGYQRALDNILKFAKQLAFRVDPQDEKTMIRIINGCIGTKFANRWGDLMCKLAFDAVSIVARSYYRDGATDIDLKHYARVEKIPGATMNDCAVIDGCVINKDVVHPQMRKLIKNPRVVLLDCPLEYKKAQSMLTTEITDGSSLEDLLKVEEEFVKNEVDSILKYKPDIVITEKGVSDYAIHLFVKHDVTVFRRIRKTDNLRLAAVTGARIVNRCSELREEDVGTYAGLYELKKIGDEFFVFIHECGEKARACTILLRGAAKDTLMEVERNLQDAMHITRNVMLEPLMVAGGGAFEMALAAKLRTQASKLIANQEQLAFLTVAQALEVIPRTLLQNCGANVIRRITDLRARHTQVDLPDIETVDEEGKEKEVAEQPQDSNIFIGVNGENGEIVNTRKTGIWDPLSTKTQVVKSAVENATMILRIDDMFDAKVDM